MRNVTDKATFKRGLQLKNRIIMAPMTTKMSFFDGVITKDELAYYGLRSGKSEQSSQRQPMSKKMARAGKGD